MNADQNKFLNIETFNLKNLINEPTCFKSQNPSIIDLILTKHRSSFMKTKLLETDFKSSQYDFFYFKHTFTKGTPKTICYRDLRKFVQKAFNSYMESKMAGYPNSFEKFLQFFQDTALASLKNKIICYNNNTFLTKTLRNAIITGSKLQNQYNKNRAPKYWISLKKQRNKCVKILKNVKKEYLNNLNRRCYG